MTPKMVTLTVNDKTVTVPEGTSVIQASLQTGNHVPHFCWHPGLSVAGVCRFCMVRIEGMPKLQIACNTKVAEGMKVDTLSPEVKDAHKWALEFHLINHPLDCPICDQAGECELQNYYMKVGKYTSQMKEEKVLKPKALDVGDTLVLDTERCILCSRCVRFEDEITKTGTLGIFNRGDKAEIGTYPQRKITHNYSYNLADICPVGAFTSKDFRFKCRVWFLKETKTICPGCSTGCNVTLFQNKNQREYHRLKPRFEPEVNGHWMCDKGRMTYLHLNAKERLAHPICTDRSQPLPLAPLSWQQAVDKVKAQVENCVQNQSLSQLALVLTPQYTNEEYETILQYWAQKLDKQPRLYVWRDAHENLEAFDGILHRGDKNPNTQGLEQVLQKFEAKPLVLKGDFSPLLEQNPVLTLVLGPEILDAYTSFKDDMEKISSLNQVAYWGNALKTPGVFEQQDPLFRLWLRIPTTTFAEKSGTFVNFKGRAQKLTANPPVFESVVGVDAMFQTLQGGGDDLH